MAQVLQPVLYATHVFTSLESRFDDSFWNHGRLTSSVRLTDDVHITDIPYKFKVFKDKTIFSNLCYIEQF